MSCLSNEEVYGNIHKIINSKTKISEFYTIIQNIIIHSDCCVDEIYLFIFMNTLFYKGNINICIKFLLQTFDKFDINNQIDILLYLSYRIYLLEHIDIIIDKFSIVINSIINKPIINIDLLKRICFIDLLYFKLPLDGTIKTIKYINKKIIENNIKNSINYLNVNDKLKCFEKIINYIRPLNDDEIKYLYDLLENEIVYTGKIIDILLKTEDYKHIIKVYSIIKSSKTDDYYLSNNSAHYFKLNNEFVNLVKERETNFNTNIKEFIELSKTLVLNEEELLNYTNILKMILISGYNLQGLYIEDVFSCCWSLLNEIEKIDFINELIKYNNDTCGYGIVINMVCWLHYIDKGNFIIVNDLIDLYEDKINNLKQTYPIDHEIWSNIQLLNELINN